MKKILLGIILFLFVSVASANNSGCWANGHLYSTWSVIHLSNGSDWQCRPDGRWYRVWW